MKKINANSVRLETRKKVAKEYTDKIERKEKEFSNLWDKYIKVLDKNAALSSENEKLKEENRALSEWKDRLLEYMDLSDDERKEMFRTEQLKRKADDALDRLLSSPYLSMLFS